MEDVFVHEEEEKKVDTTEKQKKIPADYLPVKLSTIGKLNAPMEVHVRDYSGKDALNLSLMNEENTLDVITEVADNILWEGIDSGYLHEQELQEIMLHIYYNFWGTAITDYPYPYTEEELESVADEQRKKAIKEGKEVPRVDVPIKQIQTNPLPKDFKEPFTLTSPSGKKVTFRLSRLKDIRNASKYVDEKYAEEAQRLGRVEEMLGKYRDDPDNLFQKVSKAEIREYNEYLQHKGVDFAVVQQAQVLEKVGSKKLESLEEKIKAYHEIGLSMWREYGKFVESLHFGVDPEVKIVSPLTGE